jgi:hypothetical protein
MTSIILGPYIKVSDAQYERPIIGGIGAMHYIYYRERESHWVIAWDWNGRFSTAELAMAEADKRWAADGCILVDDPEEFDKYQLLQ